MRTRGPSSTTACARAHRAIPPSTRTASRPTGRASTRARSNAPRARWIRTANDSYFTAMTYPEGLGAAQPSDIHDATWGVVSAVYGGAIHPTAEGHAVMANAALAEASRVLGLTKPNAAVVVQPLPLSPTQSQ